MSQDTIISGAYIVSGMPHILLAKDQNPAWQNLYKGYAALRQQINEQEADLILYFSTQWHSILGYMFQANPHPEWTHVDQNWHMLGDLPYRFNCDVDFAKQYATEVSALGFTSKTIDYQGFPIDTATVVAQKLLNPDNRLPASMVSCNIYAEKQEMTAIGAAASRALKASGKRAIVVLVSNLSNRYLTDPYNPEANRISCRKDHEWNLKILDMLTNGQLEDVAQCAREFASQANADMKFKGIWWLNGLCGQHNDFSGQLLAYEPVWGCGAGLVALEPRRAIYENHYTGKDAEEGSQAAIAEELTDFEGTVQSEISSQPVAAGSRLPDKKPSASLLSTADDEINCQASAEPVGLYPHARRWGNSLYLSGIGPRKPGTKTIPGVTFDEKGELVSYDIEAQTKSVIENIQAILEEAGSSLEKVLDVQVFLVNMKADFQRFNQVYNEAFKNIRPTRTTVEVGALPTPIAVEFKVIARA